MGLTSSSGQENLPNHIAIIMDGNGRWAKERNLSRIEGHAKGVENTQAIIQAICDASIPYLTLYAFSTENWKRPTREVESLFSLLYTFLKEKTPSLVENAIRFRVIGRFWEFPQHIVQQLEATVKATGHHTKQHLTLALNYSSRVEVLDAVKAYLHATKDTGQSIDDLDWDTFSQHLYTKELPDPDLIIRTSGEMRTSNFLLLQGAYAEMYFTPTYWPEFKPDALFEAIRAYQKRERRFGKTGEQIQGEKSPVPLMPNLA